jgi:hypothetical protein
MTQIVPAHSVTERAAIMLGIEIDLKPKRIPVPRIRPTAKRQKRPVEVDRLVKPICLHEGSASLVATRTATPALEIVSV